MKKSKRVPSFGQSCLSMKYLLMLQLNILVICLVSMQSFAGNIDNRLDFGAGTGEKTGADYFQLLVTGNIVNETGTPLAGVTISEKGTNNITSSKPDGSFSIIVAGE